MALELAAEQIAVLERLAKAGYEIVAFPMYASAVGVRRGECAALLERVGSGMQLLGEACWLIEGNLSVRVRREGRAWFVWKNKQVEATEERVREVERFQEDVKEILAGGVGGKGVGVRV
jgi:hypothetical protein